MLSRRARIRLIQHRLDGISTVQEGYRKEEPMNTTFLLGDELVKRVDDIISESVSLQLKDARRNVIRSPLSAAKSLFGAYRDSVFFSQIRSLSDERLTEMAQRLRVQEAAKKVRRTQS